MDQVKAGIKTSEFWIGLVGAILVFLNSFFKWNVPVVDVLGVLGVIATYIWGRSKVKSGQ